MTQIAISHVGSVAFSTESGRGVAIVVCVLPWVEGDLLLYQYLHTHNCGNSSPFFSQNCVPTCETNILKSSLVAFFALFGLEWPPKVGHGGLKTNLDL